MVGQYIGNYRIVRQLGEGGMGVVYEAVRDDIAGRAAIKVLKPEYARNADVAGRFFNEARAANMVEHPSIVRVFDYGHTPGGAAYLAMEYLDGESLRQRLERESRLNEVQTMRIGRQVASALAIAHSAKIVHRDLKPENVMMIADAEAPGGERVKILDFGIAKLATGTQGSVRTHANAVMGTPAYMSPEQCRGPKNVDDRTDVYALGVMLFEMMAGRPPFWAELPGDVIAMHMYERPPELRTFVPDVDPKLYQLIYAMLSKDAAARPPMVEVARVLKYLGNLTSDVLSVHRDRRSAEDLPRTPALVPPPAQLPVASQAPAPPVVNGTRAAVLSGPDSATMQPVYARPLPADLPPTVPMPVASAGAIAALAASGPSDATEIMSASRLPAPAPAAGWQSVQRINSGKNRQLAKSAGADVQPSAAQPKKGSGIVLIFICLLISIVLAGLVLSGCPYRGGVGG